MVNRWDIVTIGNLSRNRYWGESDDRVVRPPLCTSTLIQGQGFRLLTDPPLADAQRMAVELDRRTGLKAADIGMIFVTHEHGDHHAGLPNFPDAQWFAAPAVADAINSTGRYPKKLQPVLGRLAGLIDVIPTPGHTASHHSLRFDCDGLSVVIAGDAVMTKDFWINRQGFFNSADLAQAVRTMDSLAKMADVIVPGHDNWLLVDSGRRKK